MELKFPDGFFFGAATSAHQVEGGNNNDWTEWEAANARQLAAGAAKKKWPDFILAQYPNPLQKENYIPGKACDHYNRFREDFDIAKSLGHNAHRLSIEWSRVEPKEGKFNEREIAHYRQVIQALRERGIEPFVTLWHWSLPAWFAERGGWLHKNATGPFIRFVKRVVAEYGGDVKFWLTCNEPETFARHGYLLGDRPPNKKNIFSAYRALKNILAAHQTAYREIKKIAPHSSVGFAESLVYFEPYSRLPHHILATRLLKWWRNNPFFAGFASDSDFIGLQYYFHSRIRLNPFISQWGIQFNENKAVSDLGWEIYPKGIYHILKGLKEYGKPVYVTENGVADARDLLREKFIADHLEWTRQAIAEGTDVRGYFYWSLLDNFEWSDGFWPRFGLVEVDYKAMERRIRPSAWEYKKIIENHGIL